MNRFDLQLFAVDTKTVKSADLAKVRDVDFTEQFVAGIQTLMTMLGVTRKLEKKAGETLKVYKVTGTLESGTVAEGEVIPLSKYTTSYIPIGEATLKKWRKVTTAEAISEKGYGQAVNDTNAKMLKDIQKGIRGDFVKFLVTGTGNLLGCQVIQAKGKTWRAIWQFTQAVASGTTLAGRSAQIARTVAIPMWGRSRLITTALK